MKLTDATAKDGRRQPRAPTIHTPRFVYMRPVLAIAWKTIQSAIRSRVVHVLLFLLLLTTVLLPLGIAYDGTARGLVQVSLTYTLGLTMLLLSLSTVWLGCTQISDDIESYRIHMVLTKPLSRFQYWLGRWAGLVIMHGLLLAVAATSILTLMNWRLSKGDFSAEERSELEHEILVGRQVYAGIPMFPTPEGLAELDLERVVRADLQRRLESGNDIPEGMTEDMVLSSLRREWKGRMQELPPTGVRFWRFENLPQYDSDDVLFFRYRLYVDSARTRDQRATFGRWMLLVPGQSEPMSLPWQSPGGGFQELRLNTKYPDPNNPGQTVDLINDGILVIGYQNLEGVGPDGMVNPELDAKSVVFQPDDGPNILVTRTGFSMNFARAVFLLFLEIVFLATLACLSGALLSTPVAIFLSYTYIVIGAVVQAMEPNNPDEAIAPVGAIDHAFYYVRQIVKMATVSVNEFNRVTSLAKGELIMFTDVLHADFAINIARFAVLLIIAAVCLYRFNLRELGLVVRK